MLVAEVKVELDPDWISSNDRATIPAQCPHETIEPGTT
jgi:hypothetical protein